MMPPKWTSFVSLLALAHTAAAVFPLSDVKKVNTIPVATNKFIVELDDASNLSGSKRAFSV
jgi:hypothetical protein